MNVSVIIPVKNEEKSIEEVLTSLFAQSRKPDEVVITDGGSGDRTIEIIEGFIARGYPITLIKDAAALPGRGRNLAIARARYEVIAMSDAGTVLDKYWLENLSKPFEEDGAVEIVCGTQDVCAKTLFERCFAVIYVPKGILVDGRISNPFYLGATAMRKYIWEKAGGFREDLRATEDILFFRSVKKLNCTMKVTNRAIAYWRPRSSLGQAFALAFKYSLCDALSQLHVNIHFRKTFMYAAGFILFLMGVYHPVFFIFLPAGIVSAVLISSRKHWKEFVSLVRERPYAFFIATAILLTLDTGGIMGFWTGVIKKAVSKKNG